jgi:DNA-binding helix-hairpin-helix protein with protein kinase domain
MRFEPRQGATIYGADDRPLVLDRELGKGGEGSVWTVSGNASVVAKFYHAGLEPEKARKINAMCRLKSDALLRVAAWPVATLRAKPSGSAQGLLMPRVNGHQEAHLLYTPKSRRAAFPEAQFPFIVHASVNVARAFATVHSEGQVIGDVNHGNLLVSTNGTVKLIDCDSFEISDGTAVFPCLVGVSTYTPPELQNRSFQGVRRTQQHDAFGLAVLIFHMLFLGRHPFSGIFRGGTSDKTIEDAIREYRFAYHPDNRQTEMDPPPVIPRLSEFPSDLGQLFLRAFGRDASSRPRAGEWVTTLESLSRTLRKCPAQETHHYYQALTNCPWCRVEHAFGRSMFGYKITVVNGEGFDLIAIWAQIESVRPDEPKLTPPAVNISQCAPDPRIPEIKKQRRMNRAFSVISILVACTIVAPGFIPALPALCLLIGGIAAMVKFWQLAEKVAGPITTAYRESERRFRLDMNRWASIDKVPPAFHETKGRLQNEKDALSGLQALRVQRMAELNAGLRQNQLTWHLERHRIEEASIPGIGRGRKDLLKCYGVEDASDIIESRLNIKGFGPSLKASLLGWRDFVEAQFVFNPNQGIDLADIRALDQEIAQRRAALMQSLSSGCQQLKQALLPWQVDRSSLLANLKVRAKQLAQAEVNFKALGRF